MPGTAKQKNYGGYLLKKEGSWNVSWLKRHLSLRNSTLFISELDGPGKVTLDVRGATIGLYDSGHKEYFAFSLTEASGRLTKKSLRLAAEDALPRDEWILHLCEHGAHATNISRTRASIMVIKDAAASSVIEKGREEKTKKEIPNWLTSGIHIKLFFSSYDFLFRNNFSKYG